MAAKQCWSSNRIGQTCSVPLQEILSHWPTLLLPEKAVAVPLLQCTALNESSPRRHSERSPRSEESLLRFWFFWVFLRGFPAVYAALFRIPWQSVLVLYRRQLLANHLLHAIPDRRVAFNFRVIFCEYAIVPGVPCASQRICFVVVAEVAQNPRAPLLFRSNLRTPMQQPDGLIKIRRLGHIRGNDFIVLSRLGDAVYLYGSQHRNF